MAKSKKHDTLTTLLLVRWSDAAIGQNGTYTPEEAHGLHDLETAGLLIKEDKDSVTLALDRCIQTGGLRCTLCIPRVNIKSIRWFKG